MNASTQLQRISVFTVFIFLITAWSLVSCAGEFPGTEPRKPNFVLIFVDDLGYGDLGCYGSEKNRTPNIDRLASEGVKFTDFYVASSVCTPSRAALLTGCYPRRVNMHMDEKELCVLFPGARKGLNPDEITVAEVLKQTGYVTACIGKWHLGDHPKFLPTQQGFDEYYGIPYSNDMGRKKIPLPLMKNEKVIEAPVEQSTLTRRYTEKAIEFIREHRDETFFLYLPHTMVHLPLHASNRFAGKSDNGKYGDATEEIDWSTGEILRTLDELEIDDNTLVIFTSDNGSNGRNGGSNGPLRGRKGRTDEGGMRVPCLMRLPGRIPPGTVCNELAVAFDLMPTLAGLAEAELPDERIIDGRSIWDLARGKAGATSPHEAFFYYQMDQLQCVRSGKWKLHLPLESKRRNWGEPEGKTPARLYDVKEDIGETNDLSGQHPEVVARLMKLAEGARKDLGDQGQLGENQRPAGWAAEAQPNRLSDDG